VYLSRFDRFGPNPAPDQQATLDALREAVRARFRRPLER
jgi:hypothetical protein